MIDFEQIKAIYKFGRNISLSDVQSLLQAAEKRSFAPGDYLIKAGEQKRQVFFIRKGLIRSFHITEKGEEITTTLRWENQVVASPAIILFQEPARNYYEALERSDVFVMDYDLLQVIISQNPTLETNRKFVLQNILKETLHRVDSFVLLSPEERYIQFIQKKPEIANRVPNKYIANVLGITPVSLSRIRKRIATKKK